MNGLSPDIDTVSPNQDCVGVRILIHSRLQTLGQVFLKGRILDNRNPQGVMISQIARLLIALSKAFDLLDIVDLKDILAGCTLLKE